MLGDLPIVFAYLVPGPNTQALFFLESNFVLFSCTGLNNYYSLHEQFFIFEIIVENASFVVIKPLSKFFSIEFNFLLY